MDALGSQIFNWRVPKFGIYAASVCPNIGGLTEKYLHQKKSNGAYKLTLEGKRVLILGGTSGIGLAVAEAAKAEGSDVVVVSSKQSRVDSALTLLGGGAEGYVANLSDEKTIEALFGKMARLITWSTPQETRCGSGCSGKPNWRMRKVSSMYDSGERFW
jgi:NADPH:quinone reductase-like Zn-dependent oxidoreductase